MRLPATAADLSWFDGCSRESDHFNCTEKLRKSVQVMN
jgi:hypothetical protein